MRKDSALLMDSAAHATICLVGPTLIGRLSIWFLVLICTTIRGFGQEGPRTRRVEFGGLGGVPLHRVLRYQPNQYENLFSLVNTHDDDSFPIVVGPTVALNFTKHLAFEAAALYRPIHLREVFVPTSSTTFAPSTTTTQGSWWEFPILGKVRLPGKTLTPFAKTGIVPHSERGSVTTTSSRYFRITSTTAFALGGGVEWNVSHIRIGPELRYSHWTKRYGNLGWSATPDRVDLLVGLTIH
jgi:hypothetical protein